jgi:drug/metabolite transporter (DMT)-like permease
MNCSLFIALSFAFCAFAYGASSAAVAQALKTFTPELIIVFRMLFGCGFCICVLIVRMIFERDYKQVVRLHFTSGLRPILHMFVGGLLNLAIPHSLIAIAQQWIPSAAVQLAKPLTPTVSQICSHFWIPDERFTFLKAISLVSAVTGVTLSAIPSFLHTDSTKSAGDVFVGYILLVVAVTLFGIATVYFKVKVPNTDITVSSMIQTGGSFLVDILASLIMDGPTKIKECLVTADWMAWMWPLMLGVLASGVAVHGFMYLVNNLGAVGANFVPFGQIIVGVTLGVAWLNEWGEYATWEIAISVLGVVCLIAAIVVGFWHGEKLPEPIEDEEEDNEEQIITEI